MEVGTSTDNHKTLTLICAEDNSRFEVPFTPANLQSGLLDGVASSPDFDGTYEIKGVRRPIVDIIVRCITHRDVNAVYLRKLSLRDLVDVQRTATHLILRIHDGGPFLDGIANRTLAQRLQAMGSQQKLHDMLRRYAAGEPDSAADRARWDHYTEHATVLVDEDKKSVYASQQDFPFAGLALRTTFKELLDSCNKRYPPQPVAKYNQPQQQASPASEIEPMSDGGDDEKETTMD
jgi:hypothetical protein